MPKVLVQNEALEIEVEANANLKDSLKRNGIKSGGMLSDRILVINGRDNLSVPTNREVGKLGDDNLAAGYRLAGECSVVGDCEVHTQP